MNDKAVNQPEQKPEVQPQPSPVVRVDTYRRPYSRREWEGGRARRTSFTGVWTRDGKYHDID